jgi:asparagine synthase (glutamine-hydrolysing)
LSQQDFAGVHDDFFRAMDQPSIEGMNSFFVSRVASQVGLKVALSGTGGDELFGGYPSFRQIPKIVKATTLVPGIASICRGFRVISAPLVKRVTSPKYASLLEYGNTYGGAYLLRRGLFMPWELPELLDPEIVREGWECLQPFIHFEETVDSIQDPHLRVTALESAWYMRNQLLRDTDWASMAHSLEVRVPLVDWSLLRDLAPMIASQGVTKTDMAQTPRTPLPDEILNRSKTGFNVPTQKWLGAERPEYGNRRGKRGWAEYVHKMYVQ